MGDARYETFVESRSAALLRFARVLTGDPLRAATLVQAALADAGRRWREVEDAGGESAVEGQIVQAYLGRFRRRQQDTGAAERLAAWTPDADQPDDERQAELVELVDALEPRQRAVLVFRHVRHLGDEDIAAGLGIALPVVEDVGCGASEPWIERALRAHESDDADPADPIGWVKQRARGNRRRGLAITVVVLVLVAGAAVAVAPQLRRPDANLVTGTPPTHSGLLEWPATGQQATDTARLQAATAAWIDQAERGQRPSGAIYPIVADVLRGTPVVILQAVDESGRPRVALLNGDDPKLLRSDVLPKDGEVDALFLPSSLVAGIPRVLGDVQNDGLVLGPQWRTGDLLAGIGLGWQQVSPDPTPLGFSSPESSPYPGWERLNLLAGSQWLALLSERADGVVVLTARTKDGSAPSSTLQVPPAGSESLVLQPGEVQFKNPKSQFTDAAFLPADYDAAVDAWSDLGRSGALDVQPLDSAMLGWGTSAHANTFREVLLELARPDGADRVLVQRGDLGAGRTCDVSVQLPTQTADRPPLVGSACSWVIRQTRRDSMATQFLVHVDPSVPRSARVLVEVVARSAAEQPWHFRTTVADLEVPGLKLGKPDAATGDVTFTLTDPATGAASTWVWPRP